MVCYPQNRRIRCSTQTSTISYIVYDEYFADRLAFQIVDNIVPDKSELWERYWSNSVQGFIELISDGTYYDLILDKIQNFRLGELKDVDKFMYSINQVMDEITLSTIHLFAALHDLKKNNEEYPVFRSRFVNQRTMNLIHYLKTKYETPDHDLTDGVEVIADYFANFGFILEDREKGGYVHVVDI